MTRIVYLHGYASSPLSTKARFFGGRFAELAVPFTVPHLAADRVENLTIAGQLTVIEEACQGQAVILMGSSLGGYLAALYAARHPEVERLVLMAPAFCIGRLDLIQDAAQYEDFPNVAQPVLILHGTRDTVVPAALSQTFAARHPNAKVVLLDSGHELTDVMEPMWQATVQHLAADGHR